jgi:peptidoglycan hydrolase-like protein with peptidoglycan-binding domain
MSIQSAVTYNKSKGYSKDTWKQVQSVVGVTADGIPGAVTAQAVINWQRSHGLTADGCVGPATLGAIQKSGATTSATSNAGASAGSTANTATSSDFNVDDAVKYNKERGYSRDLWKKIQAKVGTTADGSPGKLTATAIYNWQKANGLTADGQCGSKTLEKMGLKNDAGSGGSYVPTGDSMTTQKYGGMYLSKYHIGLGDRNNEMWRLHPTLQAKLNQLNTLIANEGLPFQMFEGMRSPQRQEQCKQNGASKLGAWAGRHNYGLAADYVMRVNGSWSWNTKGDAGKKWQRLGQLGQSVGLTWGGSWKSFCDLPHFELTSAPSTSDCRKIYSQSGIDGLWAKC